MKIQPDILSKIRTSIIAISKMKCVNNHTDIYEESGKHYRSVEIPRTRKSQTFFQALNRFCLNKGNIPTGCHIDWLWLEISDEEPEKLYTSTSLLDANNEPDGSYDDIIDELSEELQVQLSKLLEPEEWKRNIESTVLFGPYA